MRALACHSWGRYPPHAQTPQACHWRSELAAQLALVGQAHASTLAYGAGRSYGDSCLAASDQVLAMRTLDRWISADWTSGVVVAEAGISLESILTQAIPCGWFLPVTPGTKFVTLGGAIANDVHGKNHHRRGTFGRHVKRLGLLRSDTGWHDCSPYEQTELFEATVGGLGLTGVIGWAEIQLMPIGASRLQGVTQRFGDLDEFFALSEALDAQHEFSVAWIDCAARGNATGRGVYSAADFAKEGPLEVASACKFSVPLTPPISLINPLSLQAFNGLYWHKAPTARTRLDVDYDPFFYPLDAVLHWSRVYGPRGFQQCQALIPEGNARAGIHAMLSAVAQSGTGSFLAVLKRCGELPSPGLLSFPQSGTTLALDFPHSDTLVHTLFPRLDAIVREAGGRLYPAKDAHMRAQDFQASYPRWQELEALRDPLLMSRFWQRVTRT